MLYTALQVTCVLGFRLAGLAGPQDGMLGTSLTGLGPSVALYPRLPYSMVVSGPEEKNRKFGP